jgi:hypothetical protein
MFRRATAAYAALTILVAVFAFWLVVPLRERDLADYLALLAESSMIHSKPLVAKGSLEQRRVDVQRDVWFDYDDRPIHVCLKSKNSSFSIQEGHAVEEMEMLEGWGWDLSAKEAAYSFSSDHGRLVGRDLFLDGHLQIQSPEGEIHSGNALLNKKVIRLENRVQVKSTDRFFALSDELLFFPKEKNVRLFSLSPGRVLFWKDGLAMSAPEVRLCLEDGAVQGIGDVRFSLSEDEAKNLIRGKKP